MKRTFLYLTFLLLVTTSAFSQPTNDSTWIEQFRTFREGLYHRDKETVKQFFDFPIEGNYVWALARLDGADYDKTTDNALKKLERSISPLTEKLFDLYFDQIFPKEFISSLLKIKTKELFEKRKIETPELSDDKMHFHKILAEFDKEQKILTLNLLMYSKTKFIDEDSPGGYYGEDIMIQFSLIKGKLKFTSLSMAG